MLLVIVSMYLFGFEAFQWAPTLGGECYNNSTPDDIDLDIEFQWAPTLGGECYPRQVHLYTSKPVSGFNGHPPLGVNATV